MRVIGYRKTDGGPVFTESREVTLPSAGTPLTPYERFHALFMGPVYCPEWETITIEEAVKLLLDVADFLEARHRQYHDNVMREFEKLGKVRRWWAVRKGWKEPPTCHTRESLLGEMIDKCLRFSKWMESTQYRPFYAGSDMSAYICKPRAVAARLAEITKVTSPA